MDKETQFSEIVKDNSDRIFRICGYYFKDESDRDDAFQDSLVRIWESLAMFRNRSQISTWIYRVTVNTCLTFIRKDKTRKRIFENPVYPGLVHLAENTSADENAGAERKITFFRNFLEGVPSLDRMIISLYLEELSTKEMAEVTGLSESNVRVRIHRLKERINKQWKEEQHGIG